MPATPNRPRRLPRAATVLLACLLSACASHSPPPLAEASGWSLHGQNLAGQRHAPQTQITPDNVGQLELKWAWSSGITATYQTTPVVVDGVMYVSLPGSHVAAIDARRGTELWRHRHVPRGGKLCCGPANRGVAVEGDTVYVGTVDGRLIALDRASGALRWDVTVADYAGAKEATGQLDREDALSKVGATGETGVGIGAAPIVHQGRVFIGINGVGYGLHPDQGLAVVGVSGRYGRPGLMAAFDARSGQRLWQFDITGPGWEGDYRETTPDGLPLNRDLAAERAAAPAARESWRYGGGSIYASPVIDEAQGLLIFGTGNPSPQMADSSRPGDNRHTSSLVALELATGRLRWAHQQIPHDRWGYDVASPPVLVEARGPQGERIPALAQASKLGWVYVHDRRDGRPLLRSEAFVPQRNLFTPPQPGEGVVVAPGIAGGANWSPSSWDPVRELFFVGALHLPTRYTAHTVQRPDGSVLRYASAQDTPERGGTLSAIDLGAGGRLRWQLKTAEPLIGGVLSTASGLLFSGIGGGEFAAFDSRDGRKLWSHRATAGVNAPPVSFMLDGRQHIAVAAGGNALFGLAQGDVLLVFALPETASR